MIEIRDLKVDYGDTIAVDGISFQVEAGQIYGLIGPNGAGKTTTIKAIATLLEPTYGEISVGGASAIHDPEKTRGMIGYMPDFPPVYEDLKVWEFVDLFAAAYGLPVEKRAFEVNRCLEVTDLVTKRNVLCKTLSRGMKQRALLAKTLVHEPPVLLLDEPAANLDPKARIEMRNLLKRLAQEGKAILVSSHVLTELQDLCDSIGIMREGRMVIDGKLDEVIDQASATRTIQVELLHPFPEAYLLLMEHPHAQPLEDTNENSVSLVVNFDGEVEDVANLLRSLVERGAPVKSFHERKVGVEELFLSVEAGGQS